MKLVASDNILFIDSSYGNRKFYKADKGVIVSSSAMLLQSSFKANIVTTVVSLLPSGDSPSCGAGELTLLNKTHCLFIENKDSIATTEQDGDTPTLSTGIVESSQNGIETSVIGG
jgi:hypothetical protein